MSNNQILYVIYQFRIPQKNEQLLIVYIMWNLHQKNWQKNRWLQKKYLAGSGGPGICSNKRSSMYIQHHTTYNHRLYLIFFLLFPFTQTLEFYTHDKALMTKFVKTSMANFDGKENYTEKQKLHYRFTEWREWLSSIGGDRRPEKDSIFNRESTRPFFSVSLTWVYFANWFHNGRNVGPFWLTKMGLF